MYIYYHEFHWTESKPKVGKASTAKTLLHILFAVCCDLRSRDGDIISFVACVVAALPGILYPSHQTQKQQKRYYYHYYYY